MSHQQYHVNPATGTVYVTRQPVYTNSAHIPGHVQVTPGGQPGYVQVNQVHVQGHVLVVPGHASPFMSPPPVALSQQNVSRYPPDQPGLKPTHQHVLDGRLCYFPPGVDPGNAWKKFGQNRRR